MIPDIGDNGLLPLGRHSATLDEIRLMFVDRAPFSSERRVALDGLMLHLSLMKQIFSSGSAWINGGFVTHKTWSAPKDIDVAYLLSGAAIGALDADTSTRLASLLTLQGVSSAAPTLKVLRVQPMGGLLDVFFIDEEQSDQLAYWDRQWCTVMGEDGVAVDGLRKGYVEVTW
jgi:hypothetical protein